MLQLNNPAPDSLLLQAELRLVEPILRTLLQRLGRRLNSDVADDCRQEAVLVLWRARSRLEALPPAERDAYAGVCIRRGIWRVLQQERRHLAHAIFFEEPCSHSGQSLERTDRAFGEREAGCAELLDQVGDPELAALLRTLPPRDYTILNLYYAHDLTDPAIARRLGTSIAAVKMQRHRVLAKLRKKLIEEPIRCLSVSILLIWEKICDFGYRLTLGSPYT